jgi:hypothetical protein
MKAIVAAVSVFVLAVLNAFGTAQYPDLLEIDGHKQPMHCNPLESFFEKHPEKRPSGVSEHHS